MTTVMGAFKDKDKKCPTCSHKWVGHEEKESDVNIALTLLDLAYKNEYDHAILITNDSDLAPAIRLVRKNFPNKIITTVAPPHCNHSNELIQASHYKAKINLNQLNRCLLPQNIYDSKGKIIATRPIEYDPLLVVLGTP